MIRPRRAADVYPPRGAIVVTQSFPQDGFLNSFLNLGTSRLHVPKLSWKETHYLARSAIKPQQHLFSTRIIKTKLYKVSPHKCVSLNFYLMCLFFFFFIINCLLTSQTFKIWSEELSSSTPMVWKTPKQACLIVFSPSRWQFSVFWLILNLQECIPVLPK